MTTNQNGDPIAPSGGPPRVPIREISGKATAACVAASAGAFAFAGYATITTDNELGTVGAFVVGLFFAVVALTGRVPKIKMGENEIDPTGYYVLGARDGADKAADEVAQGALEEEHPKQLVERAREVERDLSNQLASRHFDAHRLRIDMTKFQIDPSVFRIDPSKIQIDPSNFKIDPSKIRIDPATFRIDPSKIQIDPSSFRIDPERLRFRIDPEAFREDDEEEDPDIESNEGPTNDPSQDPDEDDGTLDDMPPGDR